MPNLVHLGCHEGGGRVLRGSVISIFFVKWAITSKPSKLILSEKIQVHCLEVLDHPLCPKFLSQSWEIFMPPSSQSVITSPWIWASSSTSLGPVKALSWFGIRTITASSTALNSLVGFAFSVKPSSTIRSDVFQLRKLEFCSICLISMSWNLSHQWTSSSWSTAAWAPPSKSTRYPAKSITRNWATIARNILDQRTGSLLSS